MDITSHMQEVWNGYLKSQGVETGGSQTENSAPRTIYIGPEAYGLFTMPYTSAQGMENAANNAPIKAAPDLHDDKIAKHLRIT